MSVEGDQCLCFASDAPNVQSTQINGMEQDLARVSEGVSVNMTCQIDSNPAPRVSWSSKKDPATTLLTQDLSTQAPTVRESGQVPRHYYVSHFFIASTDCTHTNTYTCEAENHVGVGADGQIQLFVVCEYC